MLSGYVTHVFFDDLNVVYFHLDLQCVRASCNAVHAVVTRRNVSAECDVAVEECPREVRLIYTPPCIYFNFRLS